MRQMSRKAPQLPRGRYQAIPEVGVAFEEFAAKHSGDKVYHPRPRRVPRPGVLSGGLCLNEDGADELGEALACPIQAALHRPQIAPGDFGDLLIALSLE